MRTSLISAIVLFTLVGQATSGETTSGLLESSVPATPTCKLDRIVFAKLASLGIEPVRCSEAVFLRRAYLDVTGTLPTAEEARRFLEGPDTPEKRVALIDHLMAQDSFADYWSMRWGDILRIKAEFPVNLWPNAAQAYHRWVRSSILENKPYDEFARELLTSSGSNFRVGPVNFFRAIQNRTPEGIATAVALTLMGSRTESWSPDRVSGMVVFFSQVGYKPTAEWKEECVFWDPLKASTLATSIAPGQVKVSTLPRKEEAKEGEEEEAVEGEAEAAPPSRNGPLVAIFPDGTRIQLAANRDPREVFADWLIRPKNPWFTRSIVNRVWAWVMGRGIVHQPDDLRDDNPPSNPKLLAYLEEEMIASGYDMKHLFRTILTSSTYQLSSKPRFAHSEAAANFASYPLRRLDAEVLIDAINTITGTTDLYTSAIPEPFTYIPKDQPAVALADGSITSPFLALFGRSARATGTADERNNKPVSAQWLHMLNSTHIYTKVSQGPKLREIVMSRRGLPNTIEEFYLTILSRFPTPEEIEHIKSYGRSRTAKSRDDWIDIAWALINSPEFLYRH